ncbi:methyltransferase domain-containing protein [Rhodobacterales bacterium HKCCSP123]|nr:methyltransferase domain-containing protein [Rhodobacterales bacterium HKCCSP123]
MEELCDFGATPLSDRLGTAPDSVTPAARVPLTLVRCGACCLPQLSVDVAPEALYDADYPYFSSVSSELNRHFAGLAQEIITRHGIGPGSCVLEAASNDGYLLRHFSAAGAEVTGYDPARGPAEAAIAGGIPTRIAFFGRETARAFVAERGPVDLFLANNVLAHVPDLQGFVAGIESVLRPGGVAVLEIPYLVDLVERRAFDTIYHQHLCYFPLTSLERLFHRAGLGLARVTRHAVHGGSLRLELVRGARTSAEVAALIRDEVAAGQADAGFVARIGEAARLVRQDLRDLVAGIRSEGGTIWAYGAAAKGNTLLSVCGLGRDSIEAVADLNPHKHGRYMPGSDLRIAPPEEMVAACPSHVLVLAWNLRDEILGQLSPLRAGGTRFILPIPHPEVVS